MRGWLRKGIKVFVYGKSSGIKMYKSERVIELRN